MSMDKLKVGVVYGGKSGEHEVSLQTAFAVTNAFDYEKYELVPFYISKQGTWKKDLSCMRRSRRLKI